VSLCAFVCSEILVEKIVAHALGSVPSPSRSTMVEKRTRMDLRLAILGAMLAMKHAAKRKKKSTALATEVIVRPLTAAARGPQHHSSAPMSPSVAAWWQPS
jgi:hypothetical protein